MGEKRTRKGQHLLFHLACFIGLMLFPVGCAHFPAHMETMDHLDSVDKSLAVGDYPSALAFGKKALEEAPWAMRDKALYQLALVYAHPGNPAMDLSLSRSYLQRLIRDFPTSTLREEARIWILMFREVENRDTEILKAGETRLGFEAALTEKDEELAELRVRLAQLKGQLEDIRGRMQQLKAIDLGIEEKKRKGLP